MNGIHDFVRGGFPLPYEPVYWGNGVGDFVNGGYPLPQGPVYMPDSNGSLPKAPPMPRAAIAHGAAGPLSPSMNSLSGVSGLGRLSGGLGCGCGPRGFSGMGTLTGDTIIPQASLPTFLQGDAYIAGFPTVYLAGIVVLGAAWMMSGKKGRR